MNNKSKLLDELIKEIGEEIKGEQEEGQITNFQKDFANFILKWNGQTGVKNIFYLLAKKIRKNEY